MKTIRNRGITILSVMAILLGFIGLQHSCEKPAHTSADTVTTSQLRYDSAVQRLATKPIQKPDTVVYSQSPLTRKQDLLTGEISWIHDTVPADTAAIVHAWLTGSYFYKQLYRDSLLELAIDDTIRQNEIASRSIQYKILRPAQYIEQQIIPRPRPTVKLCAGAELSAVHWGVKPGLAIIDRKSRVFTIGTDLYQAQPNVSAGAYFKLW